MTNINKTSGLKKLDAHPKSKKRIRDRGITWKEHYEGKSVNMKKKFDKSVGPGAYRRFIGHDYSTNGDYFIVIGPALTQDGKKQFFSGIKRLPDDHRKKVYAPSGKYFPNLMGAFNHASDKWGLQAKDKANYNLQDLQDVKIPRHVKGSELNKIIKSSNMKIIKSESYIKIEKQADMARTPSIPNPIKNKVMKIIYPLSTKFHERIPLQEIFNALKSNNIEPLQEDQTPWSGLLLGEKECGTPEASNQRANIHLGFKNESGQYVEYNNVLVLQWCKTQSNKFEINCYIS